MNLERLLPACTIEHWITQQAVVFDWQDGPRQGVCALATPECEFAFDLAAERFNPDGLDDRLFRLRELQHGTVMRIISLISMLGSPVHPIWIPVWTFDLASEKNATDAAIDEILNSSRQTNILIRTHDMVTFRGCWEVTSMPSDGVDWFAHLGI